MVVQTNTGFTFVHIKAGVCPSCADGRFSYRCVYLSEARTGGFFLLGSLHSLSS